MKTLILTLIALLHIAATPGSFAGLAPEEWPSQPVEIRAVWMDRRSIPKTEQGIRDLIRSYARAGINLIHPEVIYNGHSAYPSAYLTQQDLWGGLDMLGILIDEAHKAGIEVHPWVWVFRVGSTKERGGILEKHPEWAAINKEGEALSAAGGYWVSPCIPAARQLLLNAIRELAEKYPVDGVHLDYIRFESQTPTPYDYGEACRSRFKAEYGIDPLEIEPFTRPALDWHLWRENLVNTFVAEVSRELRKVRQDIRVSAAVGPDPDEARSDLLQDWPHWAANRWVDFLAPMTYTSDPARLLRLIRSAAMKTENTVLLAPGLGLQGLSSIEAMLEQVQVVRSLPEEGVTLFATAYLDEGKLQALAKGPFRRPAKLPFRSPVEGAKRLVSSARKNMKEGASPRDLLQAGLDLQGAESLLEYASYRTEGAGYVPPTPPPIFIPEVVQPLPTADIPHVSAPPVIDGRLDDAVWKSAHRITVESTNLGFAASQPTDAYLAYDPENLYVAFRASEPVTQGITAKVTEHDGPVFYDDSVEVFLSPQFAAHSTYFHFAMNAIGMKFEQRVRDISWNGGWSGAAGRETDAWTAEMAVPFASLGIEAPPEGTAWRANFCRNRTVAAGQEFDCWSATYGSYHTPIRFGKILFKGRSEH